MKLEWIDYKRLIDEMREEIRKRHEKRPFTAVIGISRGGLVPAAIISYELDIPLGAVFVKAYKAKSTLDEKVIWDEKIHGINIDETNIVFVDDIVDSGTTMKYLKKIHPKATTMSLFKNVNSSFEPDWFGDTSVDWVEFPYDKEEDD